MSSSLNRQNSPLMQGNNSISPQATSPMMCINNSGRNRPSNPSRRPNRGRGGSRAMAMTGAVDIEYQSSHPRGGYRGRRPRRGRAENPVRDSGITQHQRDALKSTIDDVPPHESNPTNDLVFKENLETSQQHQEAGGGIIQPDCIDKQPSKDVIEPSASVSRGNRSINNATPKGKSVRVAGGKYKQRREARQLIDGLDGLDIDLLESLTPSSADGGSRSRHQTNTRKINLSHLVNYNYDRRQRGGPRTRHDSAGGQSDRGTQPQNYRYHSASEHKFSKQQFLQANCQFVVLDGYDYTIHKVNPDWPVDWNCIEEVKFRQIGATETNCPICLEPPVAAKITKCGHIYCWACMLRYLSMCDENRVPCPICFEPIYANDLRSVVSQSYTGHVVGETITMKLMFRRKGCVEVGPHSANVSMFDDISTGSGYLSELGKDSIHYSSQANLVIVDPMTVVAEVAQRERNELQFKMELEKAEIATVDVDATNYSGMICFIEQALGKVYERIDKLTQVASDESRAIQIEHRRMQSQQLGSNVDTMGRSYLFYQSADGQHIYLNPFSTKILCQNYGSLDNCPATIDAEILQMDWISMNEAWRKRFKYLEHLPLSCEFRLIEIDFEKSNLISPETFKQYQEQITSRAKERARRLREEAKRDKLIQVEQNRKIYGIQPSLEISLDNPEQFPSVSNELYLGLERTRNRDSEDNADDDVSEEETPTDQVTLSFAEIQLQEAARAEKASRQQKRLREANPNPWAAPSSRARDPSGPNQSSSSFAQLLVDAKSSQQKWTKSSAISTSSSAWGARGVPNQVAADLVSLRRQNDSHAGNTSTTNDSDDGGEELRAPPCEFTMSDYLDSNIVTGKKRGKKKKG